jgi:hypothetical protein
LIYNFQLNLLERERDELTSSVLVGVIAGEREERVGAGASDGESTGADAGALLLTLVGEGAGEVAGGDERGAGVSAGGGTAGGGVAGGGVAGGGENGGGEAGGGDAGGGVTGAGGGED